MTIFRYVFGIVLVALVALVHSTARHDDFRRALRDGSVVFGYIMASILALSIVVFAVCWLK